jgi:hypothetical protein
MLSSILFDIISTAFVFFSGVAIKPLVDWAAEK